MAGFVERSKHRMRSMKLPVSWLAVLILSLSVIPGGAADDPQQAAAAPANEPVMQVTYANKLLSVTAKDADVRELLKTIGERAGFPVNLDPAVTGTVSVEFKDRPVDDGIARILAAAGQKNMAVEYSRKPGAGKDDARIEKLTVVRKAAEPTEAEVRAAMAQREREYRELFARLDKEHNKIARALKEYSDPDTSEKEKLKLRTYLRQAPVKKPEDKKLLRGALADPQYAPLMSDLQMALTHAVQANPEESDKEYILDLLQKGENNVGWLYYTMLNIWDDRYVPYLLEGARNGSYLQIEILGRAKVKAAVPVLEKALKSPDGEVRKVAYYALLNITGKEYPHE